jgi:feruloyl esterase
MAGSAAAGALLLAAPVLNAAPPQRASRTGACAALAQTSFAGAVGARVEILRAAEVPASATLPAFCEIEARIAPAIGAVVRLPASGASGRFLMGGCWNLCGETDMRLTEDALARGYTVAQTDMGHKGQDIAFSDDPAAIDDFAWRATHLTTKLAKALFAAFHGRAPDRSYFRGCSTGGRQGLTEALLFPDEFDGVIAGAPAQHMAAVNGAWAVKANLRADGSPILDEAAITLLHEGALAACDGADGTRDGIIDNPLQCGFRPARLACSAGAPSGQCLSPEQVTAAGKIYDGVRTKAQRFYASMGYAIGSEPGWIDAFAGRDGQPPWGLAIAANYMHRFKDLPDPPRTVQALDFDRHPVRMTRVEAIPSFGDEPMLLNRFAEAGGRMILYAGWADEALTPATTLDFVAAQQRGLGGAGSLDPFLRLYMVPGYGHCGGGPGAGEIDYLTAIENWVEKGQAPAALTAHRLKVPPAGGAPTRFPIAPDAVAWQRSLMPYTPETPPMKARP